MPQTNKNTNARRLINLFRRINKGEDPQTLRQEVSHLMATLTPDDIVKVEQYLVSKGYSLTLVHQLSTAFMLMGDSAKKSIDIRAQLPLNHVLQIVLIEHDLLRCYMADLTDTVISIENTIRLTDVSFEFRTLAHIVQHLDALKEHFAREHDVIFPYLHKHGLGDMCDVIYGNHRQILALITDIVKLTVNFRNTATDDFKSRLLSITSQLGPMMLNNLSQEEHMLYPRTLKLLDDKKQWAKLKTVCDEIGYCGVHI